MSDCITIKADKLCKMDRSLYIYIYANTFFNIIGIRICNICISKISTIFTSLLSI